MLPGIRFLFAALVLCMSLLTFGFGAAALLRSAHQEVASLPSRRVAPETMFSQPAEAPARLAMLRVEPVVPAEEVPATVTDTPPALVPPAPLEPVADSSPRVVAPPSTEDRSAELQKLAALAPSAPSGEPVRAEEPMKQLPAEIEVAKPEIAAPEAVVTIAAATPSIAEPPAAAAEPVAAPTVETAALASEPAEPTPAMSEADVVATRIATLGGPPVDIGPFPAIKLPVPRPPVEAATSAAASAAADRKRAIRRKEAAREARAARLARQARAAREARVAAQPADPFGTPQR